MNRDDHPRTGAADNDDSPASPDGMFGPNGLAQRIEAVVFGAVGCLPRAPRAWAATICHAANLRRLTAAMTSWIHGGPVEKEHFGRLFLGRDGADPLVALLHEATPCVGLATGHAELANAATKIAAAIVIVGPDRWARFLAELEARAMDPATVAAIRGHGHHPHSPCSDANPPTDPPKPGATDAGPPGHGTDWPDAEDGTRTDPLPANNPAPAAPVAPAGAGEHPRPWRVPPADIVPPVRNPVRLRPGDASRPAWSGAAERSLWDEQGGEWQYHGGDGWRHPHWDYNAHNGLNTPWRSIPMKGRSLWKA